MTLEKNKRDLKASRRVKTVTFRPSGFRRRERLHAWTLTRIKTLQRDFGTTVGQMQSKSQVEGELWEFSHDLTDLRSSEIVL
jgi:hypothetical protein